MAQEGKKPTKSKSQQPPAPKRATTAKRRKKKSPQIAPTTKHRPQSSSTVVPEATPTASPAAWTRSATKLEQPAKTTHLTLVELATKPEPPRETCTSSRRDDIPDWEKADTLTMHSTRRCTRRHPRYQAERDVIHHMKKVMGLSDPSSAARSAGSEESDAFPAKRTLRSKKTKSRAMRKKKAVSSAASATASASMPSTEQLDIPVRVARCCPKT